MTTERDQVIPGRRLAGGCGIATGVAVFAAAVLTAIAIDFSIRHGLDFLATVDERAEVFVAAAVVTIVAQVLQVPLLAGLWGEVGERPLFAMGVALVAGGAVAQIVSAAANIVLGADLAGDAVASGDAALGSAVHDVADALFFVGNSVIGLGILAVTWSLGTIRSRLLGAIAVVAAAANVAVYLAFAVEALWVVGAAGVAAIAAWYAAAGAALLRRGPVT
jgi:hypothetical protein